MNLPDLAIINFSEVDDQTAQQAIRAVNRQVVEDFLPIWGSGYTCRLHTPVIVEGPSVAVAAERLRAEAVVYLVDNPHVGCALAYHAINAAEVPVGFVFVDLGEWSVTLSHEVLELIIDPTVNMFVPGPDPRVPGDRNAWLWHAYEVCDAVERTVYEIDGTTVSNFVTPSYFYAGEARGTHNDFLGTGIASFGVLPDCHLDTADPSGQGWETIFGCEYQHGQQNIWRLEQFVRDGLRPHAGVSEDDRMKEWKATHPSHAHSLCKLTSFTRGGRKRASMDMLARCRRS